MGRPGPVRPVLSTRCVGLYGEVMLNGPRRVAPAKHSLYIGRRALGGRGGFLTMRIDEMDGHQREGRQVPMTRCRRARCMMSKSAHWPRATTAPRSTTQSGSGRRACRSWIVAREQQTISGRPIHCAGDDTGQDVRGPEHKGWMPASSVASPARRRSRRAGGRPNGTSSKRVGIRQRGLGWYRFGSYRPSIGDYGQRRPYVRVTTAARRSVRPLTMIAIRPRRCRAARSLCGGDGSSPRAVAARWPPSDRSHASGLHERIIEHRASRIREDAFRRPAVSPHTMGSCHGGRTAMLDLPSRRDGRARGCSCEPSTRG